jgi:hypothetical protein
MLVAGYRKSAVSFRDKPNRRSDLLPLSWALRGRATNMICSCGDLRRHGFRLAHYIRSGAKTAWFKDTEGNTMAISQVLSPGGPPMRRARPPTTDVMYLLVSAPRPSACRVLVVGFLVRPTGTEEH